MKHVIAIALLIGVLTSCNSIDSRILIESCQKNIAIVEESNLHSLSFFAALAAENPTKGSKYYEATERIHKASFKLKELIDSLNSKSEMLDEFDDYLKQVEVHCTQFNIGVVPELKMAQSCL